MRTRAHVCSLVGDTRCVWGATREEGCLSHLGLERAPLEAHICQLIQDATGGSGRGAQSCTAVAGLRTRRRGTRCGKEARDSTGMIRLDWLLDMGARGCADCGHRDPLEHRQGARVQNPGCRPGRPGHGERGRPGPRTASTTRNSPQHDAQRRGYGRDGGREEATGTSQRRTPRDGDGARSEGAHPCEPSHSTHNGKN